MFSLRRKTQYISMGYAMANEKSAARKSFRRLKNAIQYIHSRYVRGDVFQAEKRRWFQNEGDTSLRLNYQLEQNSVVFDIGGYIGNYASDIYAKYGCNVYLFEPSEPFFRQCITRFEGNGNIHCFNYGLSDKSGEFVLSDDADGSAISESDGIGQRVMVRRFKEVYEELGSPQIDLLKINIEGGEYDLLPHLIETGIINRVKYIQVQFHNFIVRADEKRNAIVRALQRTHNRDWCYTFIWESWSRK